MQNEQNELKLVLDEKKEMLKMYAKVWSGFTKFIKSQALQGKIVDTFIMGSFKVDSDSQNADITSEISADQTKFIYQPSTKFLDELNASVFENDYNINPYHALEKSAIVKLYTQGIAHVCS